MTSGDAMVLRYAQALRNLPPVESTVDLRLVSSSTTVEFAVFLRAYAARRATGWNVTSRDYGPLQSQLEAFQPGHTALVVMIGVEDVFPDLSYRADTGWTASSVRTWAAGTSEQIEKYVRDWHSVLTSQTGPVVVVPPVVDAPALPATSPAIGRRLARLRWRITEALMEVFEPTGVQVLDVDSALATLPKVQWRDDRLLVAAGSALSTEAASLLARATDAALAPAPQPRKVLVTDLDGTLWNGVLSEDGPDGVSAEAYGTSHVHRFWQRILKLLRDQGILLAVCSKNDLGIVRDHFDPRRAAGQVMLLDWSEFAAVSVSWQPKSIQLRRLADELGLGLEAFVLVDDNPVELAEVADALPEIMTLLFPTDALGLHAFCQRLQVAFATREGAVTHEDQARTHLYEMRDRAEAERKSAGSTGDFLAALDMRMRIEEADQRTLARAQQLFNRTNQFNLTGRRYNDQAWSRLLADPRVRVYVARLTDRYGDHGISAAFCLRAQAGRMAVEELAVSCRVFNRTVETALLDWMHAHSAAELVALWQPTGRNDRVRDTFMANGFHPEQAEGHGTRFVLTDRAAVAPECFVKVGE
jgi:FkbH-like protein